VAHCVTILTTMYSEAKQKTGKYVMSILDSLKKNLGIHAVVFVAYEDGDGMKISE